MCVSIPRRQRFDGDTGSPGGTSIEVQSRLDLESRWPLESVEGETIMTAGDATSARDTAAQRLGQRLRRARLARNLTQGEVAKNQFSVSYVSAVERGQIRPSLGALEKLAERLHVPLTDLLNDAHPDQAFSALPAERRDSGTDRWREEIEARLLESQRNVSDGRPEALRDAVDALNRLANRQLTPRETAQVHLYLARAFAQQGRADDARDEAQKGLAAADRAADAILAERLRFELGTAYSLLRSHTLAFESFKRSLQAIEEGVLRDPSFRMQVLARLGAEAHSLNLHEEALRYFEQAAEAAKQAVNPRALGEAYSALSQTYSAKGDTVSARYYLVRSIASFDEARQRREVAAVHAQYGRALAQDNQVERALSELETARDTALAQQDAQGLAEGQRALALLYLRENRLEEASLAAQEALQQAETMHDPVQRAESLLTLAQVQERNKQSSEADRSFGEAIQLLTDSNAIESLAAAYESYSGYFRRGDERRAFEMLKQAHSLSAKIGV